MHTLSQLRAALDERGISPKRSLGQNFLIDLNLARKLADEARIEPGETVLEVGPGAGALTHILLERTDRVVACELDDNLADLLRERFAQEIEAGRLTLIHGDCLANKHTLHPAIVEAVRSEESFALVANLPYGAATPLIATLLADHPRCRGQYVTIQKEVADRLLARPGTKEYGAISVLAHAMATMRRIASLPPQCFWPRPKIDSTMLAIERRAEPLTNDPAALSALCARLFSQRRKQLASILGRDIGWPEGIDPTQRPEQLTPAQMIALARATPR